MAGPAAGHRSVDDNSWASKAEEDAPQPVVTISTLESILDLETIEVILLKGLGFRV
jgi:hypothetical protein